MVGANDFGATGMDGRDHIPDIFVACEYLHIDKVCICLLYTSQEVYVVGDATRARRALDATKEAYAAAMQI